jgi:hypothetical protein
METFINVGAVIEAAVLSALLGLGLTWLALRGLFLLIPATRRKPQPVPIAAIRGEGIRARGTA